MERAKDPWALTGEEKVERLEKLKSSNAFFKEEYPSQAKYSAISTRRPTKEEQNQSFESVLAFELRGVRVETIRVERRS